MTGSIIYSMGEDERKSVVEICLGKYGRVTSTGSGMCGEIYVFDQGENVHPRYVCAKIPKLIDSRTEQELAASFVNELEKQLRFYHHMFVHWVFEFTEVMGAPVALFRYWGSDLDKLIESSKATEVEGLSVLAYVCAGLRHCYRNGLRSHQDLKPANIFLQDVRSEFCGLPALDVYTFARVADFGLADAFLDCNLFDGSRPYMAPEQWGRSELSQKTDVFSLGVILFELMTGGHHPVGIKLRDFWPRPVEGNSKKWTRPESWKKWSTSDKKLFGGVAAGLEPAVSGLVERMLSTSASLRPGIDEVLGELLLLIERRSPESFMQIRFLIGYFDSNVSADSLEEQWPYLFNRWTWFKARFRPGT